jgi:fatty aldehyde-generating acyl-ACP reductase
MGTQTPCGERGPAPGPARAAASPGAPVAAAIGHLESVEAYCRFLSATRGPGLPPVAMEQVERVIRRLEPMPICNLVVRSPTGAVISAVYVDAFLLADAKWGLAAAAEAVTRVQAAYRAAAEAGVRLVTLGGFSSIVGEFAKLNPSSDYGIAFTTGNALTSAVIAAQVLEGLDRAATTVTVVGAAGDVGSGVCRILHSHGLALRLVGRRPGPLEALAATLPGARVRHWDDAAPESDVVVLVSSASHRGIRLEGVPARALVLDAGHPPNAGPPLAGGPRYARAGRVRLEHPLESDLPEFIDCFSGGELHACLAEGMALSLEGRWESYSSGRGGITTERAAEILALAARHGIRPAPLRFRSADD